MNMRSVDTFGGHYAIVLETRKKPDLSHLLLDDVSEDVPVLFLEDSEGNLCSFMAVTKVHKINRHKRKKQIITAYHNAGWMSPGLVMVINCVVNDCRVCQKFEWLIAQPRVILTKSASFN